MPRLPENLDVLHSIDATIANGEALSGSVDIEGLILVGVIMPAEWTAAGLSFQGSSDGSNWQDVYDNVVELVIASAVVGASRRILLQASDFVGVGRYIKIRSGTTGTPIDQGAERILTLLIRPI